jgi:hypothetical protein
MDKLQFLDSVIVESEVNKEFAGHVTGLVDVMGNDTLIVCDMTDPMLTIDEVSGMFQVVIEQFRTKSLCDGCEKVMVMDEVSNYIPPNGGDGNELCMLLVDTVRCMHKENTRVLLSTQHPLILPSELYDLATLSILHQFHSFESFNYVSAKYGFLNDKYDEISGLGTGESLIVAMKSKFTHLASTGNNMAMHGNNRNAFTSVLSKVRKRITGTCNPQSINSSGVRNK